MRAAQWRWLGLALGVALGAAAVLADAGTIERLVSATGLDRLTPYAQPPLGKSARAAMALGLILIGLALGWILGKLVGAESDEEEPDADALAAAEPINASAPAATAVTTERPSMGELGWRTPTSVAAAPDGPAVETASVIAQTPPPVATQLRTSDMQEPSRPATLPAPSFDGPVPSEPHVAAADMRAEEDGMPDHSPALARIEAIVADIARHGPHGFESRFEAIDARLQQMAQQIAEIAGLARAQQRTPSALPLREARAPADPAQRRALAQTARDLRARLGEPELA